MSMRVTINPQGLIVSANLVGLCWLAWLLDAVQEHVLAKYKISKSNGQKIKQTSNGKQKRSLDYVII